MKKVYEAPIITEIFFVPEGNIANNGDGNIPGTSEGYDESPDGW